VTDLLILGIVALILLMGLAVLFAGLIWRIVRESSRERVALDQRRQAEIHSLLNRLQTIRWEDFLTAEETEIADEGGFFTPQGEPEEEVEVGGQWGALSSLRQRAQVLDENEETLLREDFPEETGGIR
jgi:hypothetical protein